MEEYKLHGRVVLHIGNGAAVVGTYAGARVLLVLAHHTHENITREVEEGVGDLRHTVLVVADGRIHLGHVGVNLGPLLHPTRTDEYVVVAHQRSTLGSGIGDYRVQLGALVYPLHHKCPGLHTIFYLTAALCLSLQLQQFLHIGHLQAFHLGIVLVGTVVDAAYAATLHGSRLCPVAIEACTVLPCLKGHIVSEVVAGCILQSLHQTVVQCAIEVVALLPCHLAYLTHGPKSQLGMCLVAPGLLALSGLTDIVGERTIVVGIEIGIYGMLVEHAIAQEDTAGHSQAVHDMSPVTIGIGAVGLKLGHHRKHGTLYHGCPLGSLAVLQDDHRPQQPVGLYGA